MVGVLMQVCQCCFFVCASVALCTLVGDPYPNEAILNPLLQHQCVCSLEGEPVFFLKTPIERQHRTCVLSFHSMFSELPALCWLHVQ